MKTEEDHELEEKVEHCLSSIRGRRLPEYYQRGVCGLSANRKIVPCRYFSDKCSFIHDNTKKECFVCKYKP